MFTLQTYASSVSTGINGSQHSDRLRGLAILLCVLGLSYDSVENVLVALAVPPGKSTVCRDAQAAGQQDSTYGRSGCRSMETRYSGGFLLWQISQHSPSHGNTLCGN